MNANVAGARTALYSALLVAISLAACGRSEQANNSAASSAPAAATQAPDTIASALSNPDRYAGDAAEDEWRHARIVLEFMGVKPGMHVLDYFAGSGYFSELLARSVGPTGSVIVYNNKPYAEFAGEHLVKRFADNRLANAKVVTASTDEFKPDPNSLDAVLFYWSYHDLYWKPKDAPAPFGNPAQVTAALFSAVKPGGVVVVVDHVANPGGDVARVVDTMHRIDPQVVKDDFTKAGFVLDASSDALKQAGDDHTKPVFDEAIRHKTDQVLFKFRKPAQ